MESSSFLAAPVKTLVYEGSGKIILADEPEPVLQAPGDVVARITLTTICGTDLHIIKGDVPTCEPGRMLGRKGAGAVESVGAAVTPLQRDDRMLISCISPRGKCVSRRRGMYLHCGTGGQIPGHCTGGVQAEYVRISYAETSLCKLPPDVNEGVPVMLSDIFPTGFRCGMSNGRAQPGNSVATADAGSIGLAPLLTAQFCSPAQIVMIDTNAVRLEVVGRLGTMACIDVSHEDATVVVKRLTDDVGINCAIKVVGVSATFELCQQPVAPGGVTASIGAYGVKAGLHLEAL